MVNKHSRLLLEFTTSDDKIVRIGSVSKEAASSLQRNYFLPFTAEYVKDLLKKDIEVMKKTKKPDLLRISMEQSSEH